MKYPTYAVESVIKRIIEQAEVKSSADGQFKINGRCPVCGDSKKSKTKKRFWVREEDDYYSVFCYNCNFVSNLYKFLELYYPTEFEDMKIYLFEDIKSAQAFKVKLKEKKKEKKPSDKINDFFEDFFRKNCIPLDPNKKVLKKYIGMKKFAIKQMEKRNIKEKFWKKFFFCYKKQNKIEDYTWRIIIPFINDDGLYYYFQGRDINPKIKSNLKYKSASFQNIILPNNKIYNFYNVDPNEVVYVCEGLLDSLFLDNSVALCNANIEGYANDILEENFKNKIWVLDNPRKDETGYERTLKLLEKGEKCFIMPKEFKDCKDINDLALDLNVKKVDKDLINSNIYCGSIDMMKFKVEMRGLW